MRLSDLYGARVVDSAGRVQGRVREVQATDGEITHRRVGACALVARLTGGREGRRIPWSKVAKIKGDGTIVVDHL